MSQLTIEQYAEGELKRIEEQRQKAIKEKGGLPYLGSLPVGESRVRLLREIPTDNNQFDDARKQFVVTKPGSDKPDEKYAWTVNPRSPLYRDLLQFLIKSPIDLRVIRTGEGQKDTRYTVKAA